MEDGGEEIEDGGDEVLLYSSLTGLLPKVDLVKKASSP